MAKPRVARSPIHALFNTLLKHNSDLAGLTGRLDYLSQFVPLYVPHLPKKNSPLPVSLSQIFCEDGTVRATLGGRSRVSSPSLSGAERLF